uniref:Uncharacterized protein LOC111122656 isoform X2 n=1 Tax=Crassostrea virginica TaxID=6565 RepID=A0A8B8CWP7_CRAVI|nr:uncharacterized protein LOC111122656 isoform X2 [Crassostrea virginica]
MDNHLNALYILVCLKYAWGLEDVVGGNLSVAGFRSLGDTEGYGYLATTPEYAFPYCGTIKRWKVRVLDVGTLWLQVWRPQKVMNYRLIQETSVYITEVPTSSEQVISIATPEIIHFDFGDVIGWKYKKKELIPSRPSPSVAGGRGFWRMGGSNISGGQVNWGLGEFVYGRQYAVSAVISQNTPPFFVNDGRRVSAYSVAIDDATDLHRSVVIIQAKDADDNVTLRVSMETESFYFQFNETSKTIYTVNWLRTGYYSLTIQATDPCGQSVSAYVTITVPLCGRWVSPCPWGSP